MPFHLRDLVARSAAAAVLLLAVTAMSRAPSGGVAAPGRPWLFVSDIHLDVRKVKIPLDAVPDTDVTLMRSFLAEARAVDSDPPVVIIAGDFIAHHAHKADNANTMALIASLFDRTFPHAQFVLTLGNNDSACGDYAAPVGGEFLRLVARAWEPLVNRNGAAPDFVRRFSHDGSYVATLPIRGTQIVVANDNFLSLRYDGKCAGDPQAPRRMLETLAADLRSAPPGTRSWVLFHEPPGVDAYSTAHIAHQLVVIPFLRPDYRASLLAILADPRSRVSLVVAGHTHKFSFRIVPAPHGAGIAMLLVPSVSPIFLNDPSFLRVPVAANASLGDVTQFAFADRRWQRFGDLASLGAAHFDVPSLRALLARLEKQPALVDRFALLYEGGGKDEIDPRNAAVYLCAISHFTDQSFESCAGRSGFHFVTGRGIQAAIDAAIALAGALVAGFLILRARRAVGA